MSKESHAFNPDVATQIGVNCAIILQHLTFLHKSLLGRSDQWDGARFWIKKSVSAFQKTYPYFSPKEIRGALDKMESLELIVSQQSISSDKSDRSKGYSIEFQGFELMGIVEDERHTPPFAKRASAFVQKGKSHLPKGVNDKDYNSYTNKKSIGDKSPALDEAGQQLADNPKQKEAYPEDFLTFWKLYNFTKGSKKKALDLWAKMSETERAAAMSALPKYVLETNTADVPGQAWKPMRCHAVVYLNQKRWEGYEDEIKEKNGEGIETPWDEAYQKYLSIAKLHWPEVLDYTAHLSKKEFVSYKEENYFDQLHRIGEPMRWKEFMKSHELWNKGEPEARKFTTVWPYHLKRLHDKIEAHNVL